MRTGLTVEGELGANIFGNGVTLKADAAGELSLAGTRAAGVGLELTACFDGAIVRQGSETLTSLQQSVLNDWESGAAALQSQILNDVDGFDLTAANLKGALTTLNTFSLAGGPTAILSGSEIGNSGLRTAQAGNPLSQLVNALPLDPATRNLLTAPASVVPGSVTALLSDVEDALSGASGTALDTIGPGIDATIAGAQALGQAIDAIEAQIDAIAEQIAAAFDEITEIFNAGIAAVESSVAQLSDATESALNGVVSTYNSACTAINSFAQSVHDASISSPGVSISSPGQSLSCSKTIRINRGALLDITVATVRIRVPSSNKTITTVSFNFGTVGAFDFGTVGAFNLSPFSALPTSLCSSAGTVSLP